MFCQLGCDMSAQQSYVSSAAISQLTATCPVAVSSIYLVTVNLLAPTNVQKKRQRNPLTGSRVFCCNPRPTQEHDQRIYAKPQQTSSHPPHRLHTSIITAFPQILHLLSSPRTLIRQSIQSLCQSSTYTHYSDMTWHPELLLLHGRGTLRTSSRSLRTRKGAAWLILFLSFSRSGSTLWKSASLVGLYCHRSC